MHRSGSRASLGCSTTLLLSLQGEIATFVTCHRFFLRGPRLCRCWPGFRGNADESCEVLLVRSVPHARLGFDIQVSYASCGKKCAVFWLTFLPETVTDHVRLCVHTRIDTVTLQIRKTRDLAPTSSNAIRAIVIERQCRSLFAPIAVDS